MPSLSPGQPLRMPPKPMISQPPKPPGGARDSAAAPAGAYLPPEGVLSLQNRHSSVAALAALSRARSLTGPSTGGKPDDYHPGAGESRPSVAPQPRRPDAGRRQSRNVRHSSVLTAFPNRSVSAVTTNLPGGLRALQFPKYTPSRYLLRGGSLAGKADAANRPSLSTTQSSDRANWEILGVQREIQRDSIPELRGMAARGPERKSMDRVPEQLGARLPPGAGPGRPSEQLAGRFPDPRRLERPLEARVSRVLERPPPPQAEYSSSARSHREAMPASRRVEEEAIRGRVSYAPSVDSTFKGRPRGMSTSRTAQPMNHPDLHQGDVGATVTLHQYQDFLNSLTQQSMKRDASVPSSQGTTHAAGEPRRSRGTILLTPEKYKEFLNVVAGSGRHSRTSSVTNAASASGRVSNVGTAASDAVIPFADEEPVVVAASMPPRSFIARRPQSTSTTRSSFDSRLKQEKAVVPSPRRDLVPTNQSPRDLVPTSRAPRELMTTRTAAAAGVTTREVVPQRNVVPAPPPVASPSPLIREVRNDIQALRMDMKDIKADVRGLRVDMSKLRDIMTRGGGNARRSKGGGGGGGGGGVMILRGAGGGGGVAVQRRSEASPRRYSTTTANPYDKRAIGESPSSRYNKPVAKKILPVYVSLETRASRDGGRKGRRKKKRRKRRRKTHRADSHRRLQSHHSGAEKPTKQAEERIIIPTVDQNASARRGPAEEILHSVVATAHNQQRTEVYTGTTGAVQAPHRNDNRLTMGSNAPAGRRPHADAPRPSLVANVLSQRRASDEKHPNTPSSMSGPTAQRRPIDHSFSSRQVSTGLNPVRRLVDDTYIAKQVANATLPRKTSEDAARPSTIKEQPSPPSLLSDQRRMTDEAPPPVVEKKVSPRENELKRSPFKKYGKRTSTEDRWIKKLDESIQARKLVDPLARKQFDDTLAG